MCEENNNQSFRNRELLPIHQLSAQLTTQITKYRYWCKQSTRSLQITDRFRAHTRCAETRPPNRRNCGLQPIEKLSTHLHQHVTKSRINVSTQSEHKIILIMFEKRKPKGCPKGASKHRRCRYDNLVLVTNKPRPCPSAPKVTGEFAHEQRMKAYTRLWALRVISEVRRKNVMKSVLHEIVRWAICFA